MFPLINIWVFGTALGYLIGQDLWSATIGLTIASGITFFALAKTTLSP